MTRQPSARARNERRKFEQTTLALLAFVEKKDRKRKARAKKRKGRR